MKPAQRLFFKILLWFWLGILVVTATLVASTALTFSQRAAGQRWTERNGPRVEFWARQEADAFERGGNAGLEAYSRSIEANQPGLHSYLFDAQGRELLERQAPPPVLQALAAQRQTAASPDAAPAPQFFPGQRIIVENIRGSSGRNYVFIAAFPPPPAVTGPLLQFLFAPIDRGGIIRLAAVLIVAGLFCYWLARYITRPIEKLREAAHAFANEKLQTHVSETVSNRRDELGELGRDFDRMAKRIHALLDTERRLLADVSHTLRSPLARLSVALGLARQQAGPQVAEHLDRIEREADLLNRLIGHVLTMARVESGIDLERKQAFDLSVLLEEVAADGEYEARSRNRGVTFTPSFSCMVEGAPEILRYAIENVVRNAVRYTGTGTNVEITLQSHGRWPNQRAVIQVRDHGPGVPENELPNLFVRFHRVPNGARQDSGGTGLGLAITERAFRLHEGRVTAANAPGGGLVVTLELPMITTTQSQNLGAPAQTR